MKFDCDNCKHRKSIDRAPCKDCTSGPTHGTKWEPVGSVIVDAALAAAARASVGINTTSVTVTTKPDAGGLKYDNGKPPMSLVDRHAIEEIAKVLAFGAQKYEAHNWRKGIAYSRLLDAAMRHLFAFADGEDMDPESGLSHVAHAGCCIVFLLGMINARPDMDDRHTCAKP